MNSNQMCAKVCLAGHHGSGKTAIARRFASGEFCDSYKPTIGADQFTLTKEVDGQLVSISFWDTCGQERFTSLVPIYFRGSVALLAVFDISDPVTFGNIHIWLSMFRECTQDDAPIFLVGNKSDLEQKVSDDDVNSFININKLKNITFVKTSAKSGDGINELLTKVMMKVLGKPEDTIPDEVEPNEVQTQSPKRQCC